MFIDVNGLLNGHPPFAILIILWGWFYFKHSRVGLHHVSARLSPSWIYSECLIVYLCTSCRVCVVSVLQLHSTHDCLWLLFRLAHSHVVMTCLLQAMGYSPDQEIMGHIVGFMDAQECGTTSRRQTGGIPWSREFMHGGAWNLWTWNSPTMPSPVPPMVLIQIGGQYLG